MRTTTIIATLLLAPVCMVGCEPKPTAAASASATTALDMNTLAGEWKLVAMSGKPLVLPAGARAPTIDFGRDGRFAAFGGVNRINGGFDASGLASGAIKFLPGPMTLMAGPEALMELETGFNQGLAKSTSARLVDGQLVLGDAGGELLRFARAG